MTDNTATYNEGLWLPEDSWATIASFLENEDLATFRQLCQITQFVGSHVFILQPLYNRLYAIDNTLPPMLPPEGTLTPFKQAFEKIQARQQFEITYLTQHHPALMAKPEYVQAFQESTVSLQSLEAINAVLDKINSEIIMARVDVNSSRLDLDKVGITRLPVTLFQEPAYTHFWQNLTYLICNNNQLTALNVQGLVKLQELWCDNNQLTTLNIQGLAMLKGLWCYNNQLTALNMQGLAELQEFRCDNNQLNVLNLQGLVALTNLDCSNNPLETLILTGVPADIKNSYTELERRLLFNKLRKTDCNETRQAIIYRLGANYTYKNCFYYCPVYAATLFASDSVNSAYNFVSSALSQTCDFLPSFSFAMNRSALENTEKKRHEDEMHIENRSEESDNQPTLKKRKEK